MNLSQKCNCCVCEPVCKWKEVYQKGVETILDTTIPANQNNSFWRLRECPHIEVSIRCPHIITHPMVKGGFDNGKYIEREANAKSICRSCLHSYVCERFIAESDSDNKRCLFSNDHFISAADVVEVVRCEDCKWRDEDDDCTHEWWKDDNGFCVSVKPSGFCNFGERKDNG